MKFITHTQVKPQLVNHPNSTVLKKILISNGVIPSITNISLAIIKPNDNVPTHTHNSMYEVYLVKRGALTFIINDHTISASEGDCVVIEPGDSHELKNTTQNNAELFYFGYTVQ